MERRSSPARYSHRQSAATLQKPFQQSTQVAQNSSAERLIGPAGRSEVNFQGNTQLSASARTDALGPTSAQSGCSVARQIRLLVFAAHGHQQSRALGRKRGGEMGRHLWGPLFE